LDVLAKGFESAPTEERRSEVEKVYASVSDGVAGRIAFEFPLNEADSDVKGEALAVALV